MQKHLEFQMEICTNINLSEFIKSTIKKGSKALQLKILPKAIYSAALRQYLCFQSMLFLSLRICRELRWKMKSKVRYKLYHSIYFNPLGLAQTGRLVQKGFSEPEVRHLNGRVTLIRDNFSEYDL